MTPFKPAVSASIFEWIEATPEDGHERAAWEHMFGPPEEPEERRLERKTSPRREVPSFLPQGQQPRRWNPGVPAMLGKSGNSKGFNWPLCWGVFLAGGFLILELSGVTNVFGTNP